MTTLILALALGQLPATFPPGSGFLRGQSSWLLVSPDGVGLAEFSAIDGLTVLSIGALPDGSGVVFTAQRPDAQPGLFRKQAETLTDLSISSGYHAWPSVNANGKTVAFVSSPAADSGPMGVHGMGAYAQLWTKPLSGGKAQLMTSTPGCKAAPRFVGERIIYEHSSCRGTTNVERYSAGQTDVLFVGDDRQERVPMVSPDRKHIATARRSFEVFQVVISDYPRISEGKTVATVPRGNDPSIVWTRDSKFIVVAVGASALKVDVLSAKSEVIWEFGSLERTEAK